MVDVALAILERERDILASRRLHRCPKSKRQPQGRVHRCDSGVAALRRPLRVLTRSVVLKDALGQPEDLSRARSPRLTYLLLGVSSGRTRLPQKGLTLLVAPVGCFCSCKTKWRLGE